MKKSIRKWMALALSAACALGLGSGITGFAQETETEQIQEHPAKDVTYLTVFTPQQSCYMNMEDIVKKYPYMGEIIHIILSCGKPLEEVLEVD